MHEYVNREKPEPTPWMKYINGKNLAVYFYLSMNKHNVSSVYSHTLNAPSLMLWDLLVSKVGVKQCDQSSF